MEQYPFEFFEEKAIVIKPSSEFSKNSLVFSPMHIPYIEKIIASYGTVIDRIEKMAQNIIKDYTNKDLYLLVVMKGAIYFSNHLAEKMTNILKNNLQNNLN